MALCELLEEENKDIVLALLPNMKTLIESFCNEHAVSQIPDPQPAGDNTPTKNFGLAHSNTFGAKIGDFSSLHRKNEMTGRGGFKKLPSMNMVNMVHEAQEEEAPADIYIISPEFKSEQVYQELLQKLLIYDEHIHGMIGLWR